MDLWSDRMMWHVTMLDLFNATQCEADRKVVRQAEAEELRMWNALLPNAHDSLVIDLSEITEPDAVTLVRSFREHLKRADDAINEFRRYFGLRREEVQN